MLLQSWGVLERVATMDIGERCSDGRNGQGGGSGESRGLWCRGFDGGGCDGRMMYWAAIMQTCGQ